MGYNMNKGRRVEIWVGFFVVLGIASLLMLALQVSGLSAIYSVKDGYKVKAYFTNIGSLKPRSKVTICGVTVGRVLSINLTTNEYSEYLALVEISLYQNFNEIPIDSSAKILTAGLLGDNYIEIIPGNADEYLMEESVIELTSQAVLLEDLISKFATGS